MYSISYVINKLSKIIKKDEIQSLFFTIDNTDIIFICKYLDSIIYNINTKNIGLISIEIFKKHLIDYKDTNNKILSLKTDEYIINDYDKKAINKILYWMETYNYIDKDQLFEKPWIINTHYTNYPKLWLSTMFVFNIIRQYKNYTLDYLLHIKQLHITHIKLLDEKKFKNLKFFYYNIYKNKDLYENETLNIINNTLVFIGSHDIQIIYNIELFNDNINNYINNYINYDDIYNIELKRKCLIQYLNIIINIIDNIMYEKGYVIKKEEINQLINNPFINNPFINIIFTVLFVLFIIIFYNIPNLKYYYKYYLTNIF
jgi:hypothetical protein